jgi:hypothetical protein
METELSIIGSDGKTKDWQYVIDTFGPDVHITRSEASQVYRLVGLVDSEGPATLVATVQQPDGSPQVGGCFIVRSWPDATPLPAWPGIDQWWTTRGDYAPPKEDGTAGFGMGIGDYYSPGKTAGASGIWIARAGYGSDYLSGLGMLGATNHRHLDSFWQLQENGASPEPDEGPAIVGLDGSAQKWPWIVEMYGGLSIGVPVPPMGKFCVTKLLAKQAAEWPQELTVRLLDEDGDPVPNIQVTFARIGTSESVKLITDSTGYVRFAVSKDQHAYDVAGPASVGPMSLGVGVKADGHGSVFGLGVVRLRGTHGEGRWLDVTFQRGGTPIPEPTPPDPEPPPPDPEPPPEPPVEPTISPEALAQIRADLNQAQSLIADALSLLPS